MNIANRITLWVLFAAILVITPMTYFSYRATWNALRKQFSLIQPLFTSNVEAHISGQCALIETVVQLTAYEVTAEHVRSEKEIQDLFRRCLNESDSIFGMSIALGTPDPNSPMKAWYLHRQSKIGQEFAWIDIVQNDESVPVRQRDWFSVPIETQAPFWTNPYVGRYTHVPMITYAVPLINEDRTVLGVLSCDVSLYQLDAFINAFHVPRGRVDRIVLLAKDGTVLADNDRHSDRINLIQLAEQEHDASLAKIVQAMVQGEAGEAEYRSEDGQWQGRVVYMPVADYNNDGIADWSLGVFVPISEMRRYAFITGGQQVMIGLGGLVLLLIAFRRVAEGIAKPIRQLRDAALTIAAGNLDANIPQTAHNDEVAHLGDSFQKMQHELKSHITSLAEATRTREKMESELRIARNIQMSLVPSRIPLTPLNDRFELAAFMEPAKEVGGDFYDYFLLNDETLCLVIADVSGKGVPASLLMARTTALFHSSVMNTRELDTAMVQVNLETCSDNEACMFITMYALTVHLPTGQCNLVNAGHNPPFHLSRQQEPQMMIFPHGLPIGVDESGTFPQQSFQLQDGDTLFLYTDGVTEAMNGQAQLFGEERTAEALAESNTDSCDKIIQHVKQSISNFVQGNAPSDDITMLALRWYKK